MCFQNIPGPRLKCFVRSQKSCQDLPWNGSKSLCQVWFSNQSATYRKEHVFQTSQVACLAMAYSGVCVLVGEVEKTQFKVVPNSTCNWCNSALQISTQMVREPLPLGTEECLGIEGCRGGLSTPGGAGGKGPPPEHWAGPGVSLKVSRCRFAL